MTTIATQTLIKGSTFLSWSFSDMINCHGFQFGANSAGIHRLNTGEDDSSIAFTKTLTLATTDLNVDNVKRARYLDIGIDTDGDFTAEVELDGKQPSIDPVSVHSSGLQKMRVPVGSDAQGRYFRLKISSEYPFRLDFIKGLFIVRPLGIRG